MLPFNLKSLLDSLPDIDFFLFSDLSYEYRPQDAHPRPYSYQQQRRLREPSAVFEQQPPLYNRPIRGQQLPLFSPVYTTPTRTNVQPIRISLTPSIHTGSPPSYEEIFLTPHRLTD